MLIYDTYDCMAFWLIAPMTILFIVLWVYAADKKAEKNAKQV